MHMNDYAKITSCQKCKVVLDLDDYEEHCATQDHRIRSGKSRRLFFFLLFCSFSDSASKGSAVTEGVIEKRTFMTDEMAFMTKVS